MALLALLPCATTRLSAQQPSSADVTKPQSGAQQPVYTLVVTTREVVIDVVATDPHGDAVRGLQASDLKVFQVESGHKVQQPITSCHLYDPALETNETGQPDKRRKQSHSMPAHPHL